MSLRPTFLGFETMSKALTASQKSLDITGNNITNSTTVGYSRQRLDVYSINSPGGGLRYKTSVALAGQGVGAAGVTQIRDPFLDKRYRELNADSAMAGTTAGILVDVENVLDCIDTEGFNGTYTEFKKALSGFTVDSPDRKELANITLNAAQQMVSELKSYNTKLNQIKDQTKFEYDAGVTRVTAILKQISELNKQIKDSYVSSGDIIMNGKTGEYKVNSTYGPNELKDTRNNLLDELSNYGNIKVNDEEDGTITVKFANITVVEGDKYQSLHSEEHSTDTLKLYFMSAGDIRTDVKLDVNGLSTGGLRGYLEMYNGAGVYANDVSIRKDGLKSQLDDVNQILYDIESTIKAVGGNMSTALADYAAKLSDYGTFDVNPTTGVTKLNGVTLVDVSPTGDVSVNKLTVSATDDNNGLIVRAGTADIAFDPADEKILASYYNDTADNNFIGSTKGIVYYQNMIDALANTLARAFNKANSDTKTIDPATGKYVTRAMFEPSDDGAEITAENIKVSQLWIDDPMMIAYQPDGKGSVKPNMTELDPKYLNNVKKVLTDGLDFTIDIDTVNEPNKVIDQSNMTIEQYIQYWSNDIGQNIEYNKNVYDAADTMATNVAKSRDSVMGINIEEEGVNMMNYQKWFNAAARMMTTMDEALNTIINNMGLVGR